MIASLVVDPSGAGQRRAADRLAGAVDAMVRQQLAGEGLTLVPKRRGRPAVADAWARSLVSADPWLPASLDPAKVRALAEAVTSWIRSGAVIAGRLRLCLRVREPARGDGWTVELLAQDRDEPSLVLPLADVWAGRSPFGPSAVEDVLTSLGRMVRLAPELGAHLDEAAPDSLAVDGASVIRLLRERAGALDDAGIGVLLPSWWTQRPRLGLRAKATKQSSSSSGAAGGLGIEAIVGFSWEAALGERRLSKPDLAALARAVDAKRSLVRLRGQWVEIDPVRVGALLESIGTSGTAAAGDLLRAGMGLGQLGVDREIEVVGVDASAVPWLSSLLDDALHATVEPVATPDGFDGELRPYQQRGTGWLAFLDRLGLGACLADDTGLGKTAQLIATLLADPVQGSTLIVCPVSVLGNWERELARLDVDDRRSGPGIAPHPLPRHRVVAGADPEAVGGDRRGHAGQGRVRGLSPRRRGAAGPGGRLPCVGGRPVPTVVDGAARPLQLPRLGEPLQARRCRAVVFADQVDTDPWVLLAWRGRTREEVLGSLRDGSGTEAAADEITPWWPFTSATMPRPGDLPRPAADVQPADPAHADAVLNGLEALDVTVAGVPFREAVRMAYDRLVAAGGRDEQGPGYVAGGPRGGGGGSAGQLRAAAAR